MSIGPLEIAIIVLLFVLLFGAKKLPDAARSIGRSARIFKSEIKEMSNDDERHEAQQRQIHAPAPVQQPNIAQPGVAQPQAQQLPQQQQPNQR
ncbi:Sec-independent protein translocase subunit TatA [Corynebacterium gerontici]|uniref:Sec-independent protein translocase protein TatA n=1 Tax=Corynebacterium gerontici TaxID=2079234 RepID=A0A3G6J061_9CORY|nr:Sec-independent protein translocase subunit TatA [Corynebacterium gerontici]AZA11415.1 Sec-independent protein translocase protein TatAy [Corynebacterium gerontici]